ncbi:unnamed protein product [Vicia faba]|uniref:Amino acid transporter transmembrane domain-containing protein n=1 Tax=Vicia faba TaxID=3906 RepID=A0AAV0ZIU1_VICFA|nr:unnamed protein product [Vicia faba]
MAGKQGDRYYSIEAPLLNDEKVNDSNTTNTNTKDPESFIIHHVGSASVFKTCFNLLNVISGVGIVSMPYALASGGWLSIFLLFTIAIACCYTGTLVKKCMDMDPDIRTFPDIGFLILEGDNLNKLIPNVEIHIGEFTIVRALNWTGIPSAVSLYAFCYSAHPVLPTLYNSMKTKSQFSRVLIISFSTCTFGYAAAAFLGYLMFGQEVESQVTLNLQTGKLSSRIAIYTNLVNPIAKYALMLTPVVNAVKAKVSSNKRVTHMIISTSLLVTSLVIAVAIPLFGYLMSLVGALLSISASTLVPSICYLKISGDYKRFGRSMIINYSIIIMGVAIAVFGTYTSLVDIIQNL